MIYQPKKVREMWDTWLYYHEGKHYLYYLHKSTGDIWDGISVAVSTDGVHYEEIGPILQKRDDAEWLGSGSIWKVNNKFVLNFSEQRNGVQTIFFAVSDDLINWKTLGEECRCEVDPEWYDNTPSGRWDCIWAIPKPEGGFLGYLTARPWNKIRGLEFESVGKVESDDGIHWRAVKPPIFNWGEWPQMNVGEVGAVEKIGDRYYMLLGYAERGLGQRQLWDYNVGNAGMFTFVSDNPEGPFSPDTKSYRLLGSVVGEKGIMTYFARFYPTPDEMLVTHHSIAHCGDEPRVWMAPLKKAVVDKEGHLYLCYWKGNDSLKGKEITIDLSKCERIYPRIEVGEWNLESCRFEADEPCRGGIALINNTFDINKGVILEGKFALTPLEKRWGGIGLFIETGKGNNNGTAIIAQTRRRTEIGTIDAKGIFNPNNMIEKGIENGKMHSIKFLIRRGMFEFYIDEMLVQCYSLSEVPTGRLGFVFESGKAVIEGLKAWEMDL